MLRVVAIAAMLALAAPNLVAAEEHREQHKPPPGPHGPPPGPAKLPPGPAPHGPPPPPRGPAPMAAPHPGPGGPARQFSYHGHLINPVHAEPFVYPPGWAYRQWAIGMALPAIFLTQVYWYADWAALGLAPPRAGFQWVRYGPDLLLVDVNTGQVVDVAYGVFY
ncbi:MAG TPA: RcnB family protein [Xanthobacteraceae bacterium]|nr:RcnB family protein [Xanthobacteraceae bacterium]